MINLILAAFIACGDKETNVAVESSTEEKTTEKTVETTVETTEEYSTVLNQFEPAIKVVNTDDIQVEVFETVEEPTQSETNSNEKAELAE